MKYDLEVIVPICNKYKERICFFRTYGLLNIRDRKVLVNFITSDENIDLESWNDNIDINIVKNDSKNYVKNIFSFYLNKNPEKIESRWIIKLDDDSSTDVDGLVSRLDEFYDCEKDYYLAASLNGEIGDEIYVINEYLDLIKSYRSCFSNFKSNAFNKNDKIESYLNHEIECCVISKSALKKILENKESIDFLKFRTQISEEHGYGVTDCALAYASSLAKIYPIDCPFLTHHAFLHEYSAVKPNGLRNHIHLLADIGDNFERSKYSFFVVKKILDNNYSEKEKKIKNCTFLFETDDYVDLFTFDEGHFLKMKSDQRSKYWLEIKDKIFVIDAESQELIYELELDEKGNLFNSDLFLKKIQFHI